MPSVVPSEVCLEENELLDLVMGSLDPDRAAQAEAHIDGCRTCRLVLSELARIYELKASELSVDETPDEADADTGDDTPLPSLLPPALLRGGQIGRFLVVEALGAGAMGVVYAAYDPQLDRKVALKLLRSHKVEAAQGERLLREARAIAKLAHPNVVVVHDVGLHGNSVFMAMEFVDGGTLADWQEGKTREAILGAYLDAARGLAAAHRVGLVHRDFKPANVLIGRDGRARVTDFGLARLGESVDVETLPTLDIDLRSDVLTKTGTIVGTPAYMSPEQFEGRTADARSDQFSFCVALFEALCGERPFQGRSFAELEINVSRGEIANNVAFTALPRRLRATLSRGLEVDPAQRFESMEALLSTLEPASSTSRWAPAVLGGVVALGVGVFGFTMGAATEDDRCATELEAFAQVWTPGKRATLRERLIGSGHVYAVDVAEGVEARVDDYAQRWESAFEPACTVSSQSAEVACLRDRSRDLERLLSALQQGDAGVVEFAVQAVEGLEDPAACGAGEARGIVPPPSPPASLARRVDGFEARLSFANALLETRQFDRAMEESAAVREEALEVGYPPSVAEAELVMGQALAVLGRMAEAETTLASSARSAWASGYERVALEASVELVIIAGVLQNKPDAGEVWAEFSGAALQRAGGTTRLEATLAEHRGALAHHRRDFAGAERALLRALELREASMSPNSTPIASALSRLASAVIEQERFEAGLVYAERALEIYRVALGEVHPNVMRALSLRGAALLQLGRLDDAERSLEEALRVGELSLGSDSRQLVDVRHNLASVASRRGNYDVAEVQYQKVFDALMDDGGVENPALPVVLHNLGSVAMHAGDLETARSRLERALALKADQPASSVSTLSMLAVVSIELDQCEAAVEHAERASTLAQEAARGAKQRLHAQGVLADALLCAGKSKRAATLAREAFAMTDDLDLRPDRGQLAEILADAELAVGNRAASEAAAREALAEAEKPEEKAAAQFRLARATASVDLEGARTLAREALPSARRRDRARIERFLSAH